MLFEQSGELSDHKTIQKGTDKSSEPDADKYSETEETEGQDHADEHARDVVSSLEPMDLNSESG